MTREIELSQFKNGQWQELSLHEFAGKSLKDILLELDGTAVVGRVGSEKGAAVFAGTPELCQILTERGNDVVMPVAKFLDWLEKVDSNALEAYCPIEVANVFPGQIESFCAYDNR